MNLSERDIRNIRDRLHNLDLQDPQIWDLYKRYRQDFLVDGEGYLLWAYDDATGKRVGPGVPVKGNVTVGVGFNMSRDEAREEWEEALGKEVDFDAVKSGQRRLLQTEVKKLLDFSLEKRAKSLKDMYGERWHRLRANERLAIESAYYNCPKLVDAESTFCKRIKSYYKIGFKSHLREAMIELRDRSNRGGNRGLAMRRQMEALLLDSTQCPLYSGPFDARCPKRPFTVVCGQTVVPRGVDAWNKPPLESAHFYIWRTSGDDRVRESHRAKEGMVFAKKGKGGKGKHGQDNGSQEHPGEAINCRCWQAPLPYAISVHNAMRTFDGKSLNLSLAAWMRGTPSVVLC